MDKHEQLMEQFNRLYGRMLTSYGAKCACDVTEKQWKNATERFARGAKREELVGFLDTTIAGSGKNGYLFTDEKIYYLELLEKPKRSGTTRSRAQLLKGESQRTATTL